MAGPGTSGSLSSQPALVASGPISDLATSGPCQLRQRNVREGFTRLRKDRCHLACLRPQGRTTVIAA
jgi:hypothetical protein